MLRKLGRLFVIKTRFEAYAIIYALALGATARGSQYLLEYPGFGGKLLFLAPTGAVFLGAPKFPVRKGPRPRATARKARQLPTAPSTCSWLTTTLAQLTSSIFSLTGLSRLFHCTRVCNA